MDDPIVTIDIGRSTWQGKLSDLPMKKQEMVLMAEKVQKAWTEERNKLLDEIKNLTISAASWEHAARQMEFERDEARKQMRRMEGFEFCTCGPCPLHPTVPDPSVSLIEDLPTEDFLKDVDGCVDAGSDRTKEGTPIDYVTEASCYNIVVQSRKEALASILADMPDDDAEMLLFRVLKQEGAFVLWDPEDDGDGFLLVGDAPQELAKEALEHFDLKGANQ